MTPPPVDVDAPYAVVLGVAQDAGHPQAACTRSCCAAAFDDPSRGHRVSSVGLVDGDHRVLLDATPDLPAQLHAFSPTGRVDAILPTHGHIGHYTGLMYLGREAMGASGVPVFVMPRMRALLVDHAPWSQLVALGQVVLRPLVDGQPIQVSPRLTVTPFLVPHRDELSETVGFRVEGPGGSLAYVPDIDKWSRWDVAIEQLVASVDVALLDGTFYADGEISRDMAEVPHPFVVETLARFADEPPEVRARVHLIHLNHTNPLLDPTSAAAAAVRAAGMSVAEEGDRHGL